LPVLLDDKTRGTVLGISAYLIWGVAALFGALNWMVFLWAVTNQRATEASFGYFLLPLFNAAIGLTLFRESIDRAQQVGIACTLAGVLLQIIYFHGLPLVALVLALSVGLYGVIRKGVTLPAAAPQRPGPGVLHRPRHPVAGGSVDFG
jgi:RarD protein